MKKILSITLAALMVVSMVPTAFAADVDYTNGTQVEHTGSRTTINDDGSASHNAEYTITVPAKLAPGGSGTVTLQGMWPSDATVKVTADASVDMLNSITNGDKKTLTVTFGGIELAGSNTAAVSDNATVSVSDMTAALFGTWNGKFNYQVEYNGEAGNVTPSPDQPSDPDDGGAVEPGEGQISFTMTGTNGQTVTLTADDGMTWEQWMMSDYNDYCSITQGKVWRFGGIVTDSEGNDVAPSDTIIANHAYAARSSEA